MLNVLFDLEVILTFYENKKLLKGFSSRSIFLNILASFNPFISHDARIVPSSSIEICSKS